MLKLSKVLPLGMVFNVKVFEGVVYLYPTLPRFELPDITFVLVKAHSPNSEKLFVPVELCVKLTLGNVYFKTFPSDGDKELVKEVLSYLVPSSLIAHLQVPPLKNILPLLFKYIFTVTVLLLFDVLCVADQSKYTVKLSL